MVMAKNRMRILAWAIAAIICLALLFGINLSVASQKTELARTEMQIAKIREEIRYLETEFSSRASLRQLERWNELQFGYVAPNASQYLDGERELANLSGDAGGKTAPVRVAVMTVESENETPESSANFSC